MYSYAQMPRGKWIEKCLGMVTLSGSAIWWTWETEDVFRRVREGNKYAMKVNLLFTRLIVMTEASCIATCRERELCLCRAQVHHAAKAAILQALLASCVFRPAMASEGATSCS